MEKLDKKVIEALLKAYGIRDFERILIGVISSHYDYNGEDNKELFKNLKKIIKEIEKTNNEYLLYYHIKTIKDAERILHKHPKVDRKSILGLYDLALMLYGSTAAIYVSNEGAIEYCDISYYQDHDVDYGEQGSLIKELKYNKELLKEGKCAK